MGTEISRKSGTFDDVLDLLFERGAEVHKWNGDSSHKWIEFFLPEEMPAGQKVDIVIEAVMTAAVSEYSRGGFGEDFYRLDFESASES